MIDAFHYPKNYGWTDIDILADADNYLHVIGRYQNSVIFCLNKWKKKNDKKGTKINCFK